ncbi:MAG: tetratricopeptide repeat protein [Candidatus Solibacter sp.]
MTRVFLLLSILSTSAAAQFSGWPPMPEKAMLLLAKGDSQGSVAVLRTSAEAGEAVSMFWLGRSLEELKGVPHNSAEAMRWYEKAADAGVGVAAWSLGRVYEMGRGTPPNLTQARKWYTKADELGFHRTALTVIKVRWFPGTGDLEYEPAPASLQNPVPLPSPEMAFLNKPAPNVTPDEVDLLRVAGLRGRLVWSGGDPGMFGLPARLILIAQKAVTNEVSLPLPSQGSIIYVQNDAKWETFGTGEPAKRSIHLQPQSPDVPWITGVTVELEEGGTQGGTGWVWQRN